MPIFGQACDDGAMKKEPHIWKLYIDGASRNNPGPSGAGVYLLKNSLTIAAESFFLGSRTNNQAEYLALLLGLYLFKEHAQKGDSIQVISDSQLLVRQMTAEYKVRDAMLIKLQKIAFDLLKNFSYCFCHVLRADNKEADKLANEGIDYMKPLPDPFAKMMRKYGIHF